jgi:hypothetical protein
LQKLQLLLLLREEEQKLLLLLLELTEHIALVAGRREGTTVGLLALQAVLLLLVCLDNASVLAVWAGAVTPLAIAFLVRWWREAGVARAVGDIKVTELGECRRIRGKELVANLFFFIFRHQKFV